MAIRSNFKTLRALLEARLGRRLSYDEIADQSGVSKATLVRFANNDTEGVQYSTLNKLQKFFNDGGVPCDIGDLLVNEDQSAA